MPRQVPQFQIVPEAMDVPQVQFIGTQSVPVITSVNQVTKHADIPQTQIDKVGVDMLVVMQRKVPQIQFMLKTGDVPSIHQVTKHVKLPQT